ncbi:MAG: substrate-binding domain-containing protein, partial [Victivallales bacterium]|nr:substrate-binding domain-containing protein [Victivallales bacterium]
AGAERGRRVSPLPLPSHPDPARFRHLAEEPGVGFVFTDYDRFEPLIEHCIRVGVPYAVYTVHRCSARNINQLWIDTAAAMRLVVAHLVERGHRQIAFFGDHRNSRRYRGYREALHQAGLPYVPSHCLFASGRADMAAVVAEEFLASRPELDAVACSSDLRALGVMTAARRLGRGLPEFGVAGVDNIGEIFPGMPRLTTADLMRRQVGAGLVDLVLALEHGAAPMTVEIPAALVIGETT